MKYFLLLFVLTFSLFARTTTSNEVYALSVDIQNHLHAFLKHYKIQHHHNEIISRDKIINTRLKPRNTWQKSYEILVKINMFRVQQGLPRIEPVGIEASMNLSSDMVYEMNMRILTELKILKVKNDIHVPSYKTKVYTHKTPIDNYNLYVDISAAFDELNKGPLTPNYVYAEAMRIYDDITMILNYLNIEDHAMPESIHKNAKPKDTLNVSFEVLSKIAQLQNDIGVQAIDFSEFIKHDASPSDVYKVVGLIISEIQILKAYIGLGDSITPPASTYSGKKPENVEQLIRWNLKRLNLIERLKRKAE